jgi:hypothetical protein
LDNGIVTELHSPAALAILEAIHDAGGNGVVFYDMPLVKALEEAEQDRISDLLDPLIDDVGRRLASGTRHLVRINLPGREYVTRARRDRENPITRAVACRKALLAWAPTVSRGGVIEHVSAFVGHPDAQLHGSPFIPAEIDDAAEWLAQERLVTAHRALAGMSLQLKHEGHKVLENYGGDITAWARTKNRLGGGGDTTIVNAQGAQIGGSLVGRDNTGSITHTVTTTTGLNMQEIQAWLATVQAMLPTVQIEAGQLARIEEAVEDLQAEAAAPAPREGMLRKFGQTVLDELTKGATSLALPHLAPVVMGLIEAGRALF